MKISPKGPDAREAMTLLARRNGRGAIRVGDIAYDDCRKFLDLILLPRPRQIGDVTATRSPCSV